MIRPTDTEIAALLRELAVFAGSYANDLALDGFSGESTEIDAVIIRAAQLPVADELEGVE